MGPGIYVITERITNIVIAHVRIRYEGGGAYVDVKPGGEGEWEENFDALGFLFGDYGRVEKL